MGKTTFQNHRVQDFVQFHFNGGWKQGGATICFDNLEITRDLDLFEHCYPEIFKSAAGIATKIARLQPRRIRLPIRIYYPETIAKLNALVAFNCQRYQLVVQIDGYYDVLPGRKTLQCGNDGILYGGPSDPVGNTGDPTGRIANLLLGNYDLSQFDTGSQVAERGGISVDPSILAGGSPGNVGGGQVLVASKSGNAVLASSTENAGTTYGGTIDSDSVGLGSGNGGTAREGDWVLINGGAVQLTAGMLKAFYDQVTLYPFAMNAVYEYGQDHVHRQLGQGHGVRKGETVEIVVHESRLLTVPSTSFIIDPNPVTQTTNSNPINIQG